MPIYDYKKYAQRSDEDLAQRGRAKEFELDFIFSKLSLPKVIGPASVLVLGCPDKRMIPDYYRMFGKFYGKDLKLVIIDKVVDHLQGQPEVIQADATANLPNGPFDLVYSHVLFKFIPQELQLNVVDNVNLVLKPGGIAIHIFDQEDITVKEKIQPDGWFSIDIDAIREHLESQNIKYLELPFSFDEKDFGAQELSIRGTRGLALVITKA